MFMDDKMGHGWVNGVVLTGFSMHLSLHFLERMKVAMS